MKISEIKKIILPPGRATIPTQGFQNIFLTEPGLVVEFQCGSENLNTCDFTSGLYFFDGKTMKIANPSERAINIYFQDIEEEI